VLTIALDFSDEIVSFRPLLQRYDTLPYVGIAYFILHRIYSLRCLTTRKLAKTGSIVVFWVFIYILIVLNVLY
jgi:hypothetical protein